MKKLTHLSKLQNLLEIISDRIEDIIGPIRRFPHKISRSFAFAKIGYNNHDFDDYYIIELEVFKLKRMLYAFEKYGYHDPECDTYKPKMKSLKLAIKLGERWMRGDYYRFHDLHEQKYGKIELGWESIPGSNNSKSISLKNGKKYERSIEERIEFLEAHFADEREQEKHRRLFYNIINKYGRYWWD